MVSNNTKEANTVNLESSNTNRTSPTTVTFDIEAASHNDAANVAQDSQIVAAGDVDDAEQKKSKQESKLKKMYTGTGYLRANAIEKSILLVLADQSIIGLANMSSFASTILWMMNSYLTDVWKFNYTYAAGMLNIWSGSILVIPLLLIHVADIYIGNFYLITIGSLVYTVALSILSASNPPARCDGNAVKVSTCASKEKNNLYAGLVISAIGIAGIATSITYFAAEDSAKKKERKMEPFFSRNRMSQNVLTSTFLVLLLLIYFDKIKSWRSRFLIAAVFIGVASVSFIIRKNKFNANTDLPKDSESRLIFSILRVVVASTCKVFESHPGRKNLYKADDEKEPLDSTLGLNWLEKAAIVSPGGDMTIDEQKKNRWRLCSVTEVEQTKIVFRMFPLWITWLVLGVVLSMGDTYFLEQANHLNPKLGKLKVPLVALLGFQAVAGFLSEKLVRLVCKKGISEKYKRARPAVFVGTAMVAGTLCCIVAAKVEQKRLVVVMRNGLMLKPDDPIPMTLFLLVPQFILLGVLDTLFDYGSKDFVREYIPSTMLKYMILSTEGIIGIGRIGCVLSVFLVGKINHRRNRPDWFTSTLNTSRLDKYYWVLAELTAVSLGAYIVAVCWHFYRENNRSKPNDMGEVDHSNFGEDAKCLC